MRPESSRIFGLDVMRASGIVLVLSHHFSFFFPGRDSFLHFGFYVGHFGIELFFVLSGFLIGGIVFRTLLKERSTWALPDFWYRRWLRTLPNYFLFLLINIGLIWWLGFGWPPSLWKYWFFVQNVTTHPPPFFAESWSMAVEEWFYLFLPILFFVALKIAPRQFPLSSLLIIIASIAAVTVARSRFIAETHPAQFTGIRMTMIYRLDACMYGVFAAWLKYFHAEIFQRGRAFSFAIGILLLVFVLVFPIAHSGHSILFDHFLLPLTSLGAMFLLPLLDNWKKGGRGAGIVFKISFWSFALYLANLPVRYVLQRIAPGTPDLLRAFLFLFLSVLIAELVFTFYEKPIMDLRDRSPFRPRQPASASMARKIDN
jgi:peptidoglycan/LPS O-acetylase OafA/YrhL